MGSDDDMFRIWSGPEGSSHKEPLSGIRIHRAHGRFLVPRHGPGGGEVFGVSLVLGFACGIARLPNTSPPPGPRRPKITRKGAFIWRIESRVLCCLLALPGARWPRGSWDGGAVSFFTSKEVRLRTSFDYW